MSWSRDVEGLEHTLRNINSPPYTMGKTLKQRDECSWLWISKNNQLKIGRQEGVRSGCLENREEGLIQILWGPQTSTALYFSGCCEMCRKGRREEQEESKGGREKGGKEVWWAGTNKGPFPAPSCQLPGLHPVAIDSTMPDNNLSSNLSQIEILKIDFCVWLRKNKLTCHCRADGFTNGA